MNEISIKHLNTLYDNIELSSKNEGFWRYRVFQSHNGAKLKNAIQEVLKNRETLDQDHLKELQTLIQISMTYSRILITQDHGEVFWAAHIQALRKALEESKNYIDSNLQDAIEKVIALLAESASSITEELTEVVVSEIQRVEGKVLIIPETSSIGYRYRDWADSLQGAYDVEVLTNKGEIQGKLFDDFALILFPGSPSKYLRRQFFDIYLRTLLLSGITSRVTFISPSWSSYKSDVKFADTLFSGLKMISPLTLFLVQDQTASIMTEDYSSDEDFEYYEVTGTSANFESFESGGSVPCRLISLGNNLVYPVEHDARRITIFQKSSNTGTWEIMSKNPFQELKLGDFIVACVGRSETNDLRERAASKMGEKYGEFLVSQGRWKRLLQEQFDSLGVKLFERRMKSAGVSKFARARHWILPEAIQPALPADFHAMLKDLGLKAQEIQNTISLAAQFDALLITEGREAGKAITSSLAEEDFIKLDKRLSVEITLENYGDATYLISPVIEVSAVEIDCRPSQVRQVITYEGQEISL
jgi:hypothetical protein